MTELIASLMVRFIATAFFALLLATWGRAAGVACDAVPEGPELRHLEGIEAAAYASFFSRLVPSAPGADALALKPDGWRDFGGRWLPSIEVQFMRSGCLTGTGWISLDGHRLALGAAASSILTPGLAGPGLSPTGQGL